MSTTRLPAAERRAALLETAAEIFSKGSYHGTTTAEICRCAGVSEPILYRHFESKRDLYLACLAEGWRLLRELWDKAVADQPDPAFWVGAMGRAYLDVKDQRILIADLWVQALTEAADDAEINKFMRGQMRDVHRYVSGVVRRSQEAGGIVPDRDPSAEAWLFISIGLLSCVDRRVGGLLGDDWPKIIAARRQWLTGRDSGPFG
jgi:AcrR family transcriptional regulator